MFETREQVLERILDQKIPHCPHCGDEMNLWEVPPITVGDGLGWGTPFLLVPEVTNVDDLHRAKLVEASDDDVELSDASPFGLGDMCGHVWQWLDDTYTDSFGRTSEIDRRNDIQLNICRSRFIVHR